jgi:hypothetical protein
MHVLPDAFLTSVRDRQAAVSAVNDGRDRPSDNLSMGYRIGPF